MRVRVVLGVSVLSLLALGCRNKGDEDTAAIDTGDTVTTTSSGLEDVDGDGVLSDEDCNDEDPDVYPGADEICDGKDNDCDDLVDDNDTIAEGAGTTWYYDGDGDGYGTEDVSEVSCNATENWTEMAGDCDDTNANANPDATEVWYDGEDWDYLGDDDYDQDGDGDRAVDYGGGDCDDTDYTVYSDVGCRADCTYIGAEELGYQARTGVADLVYDNECNAYMSTILNGTDYVQVLYTDGISDNLVGYSDYNARSVALDPVSGDVVVGYTSTQSVGWEDSGTLAVVDHAGAGNLNYNVGPWDNAHNDAAPTSIAVGSDGCVYVPNWAKSGDLACVSHLGTTIIASLTDHIESVALNSAERLYVSIGAEIHLVDIGNSTSSVAWTVPNTVLDMVFDYNNDLYVETIDDEIILISGDKGQTLFAEVTSDGNLAISPNGYLVRLQGTPVGTPSFQEWEL